MASITVNKAAELVRRSRRTLYRDMKRGNLSFTTRRDGHRQIETSELERCYGPLKMPETDTLLHVTEIPETERLLAELVELSKRQGEELIKLREEVAQLRRLPAPETPLATPVPNPTGAPNPHPFADEMAALRAKQHKE